MFKHSVQFLLFLVLVIFVHTSSYSQLNKTHYIPPLTAANSNKSIPGDQHMYISTPSNRDVTYRIKKVGSAPSTDIIGVVSNLNPKSESLGSDYGQLFLDPATISTTYIDKGYIVEASDQIYVSIRVNSKDSAQAGALVSKGLYAAGGTEFRIGSYTNENPNTDYLNFASIMATEDNTTVTISNLPTGIILENYTAGTFPITITLNKGETYTFAANSSNNTTNRGIIGALIKSDKKIVVNCGSANGTFHTSSGSKDYGIDQIVGADKIGKEYIFVKGFGSNGWENVLLVAHYDNTKIYINGSTTAIATKNAGEYYVIEGDKYSVNGNMYVETSEDVFAYQGVGGLNNSGSPSEANQGLFFVPPLSCEAKGNVDNIAFIDKIGNTIYKGGVSIVTKNTATVTIDGLPLNTFPTSGPYTVTGKTDYVTYKITGLSGSISVQCDDELYCAYFNYNGAATSGSFYAGFPTAPEINYDTSFLTLGICIPNIKLQAANMSNFDSVEWLFNNIPTGNTTTEYIPLLPGNYKLRGKLACSGLTLDSPEIPISICPDDTDTDGIIDNIDVDNDNDGILNCTESYGDSPISLVNLNSGNLTSGSYNYTGTVTSNNLSNNLMGSNDGSFRSDVSAKNGLTESSVTYKINFNKELNLVFKLPTSTTLGGGNLTDEQEFIIQVPTSKTITLLDPDDQLLVDTNYDGVYESGITQFSSFEIRFKIKGTSLAPSTATFEFVSSMINSFSYTHKNTSETTDNTAVFKIKATCLPIDSDNDGITDEFDYDSDNDGIPNRIEGAGTLIPLLSTDSNNDGLDDAFNGITVPIDTDNDGVFDYLDLDSDNDGIYDLEESGSGLVDANSDGIIDGISTTIGTNGWDDTAETSPDSGTIQYTISNTDSDTLFNYLDADSDGDNCNDVIEAGFSDGNLNNYLGNSTVIVNTKGLVTNASNGYTTPNTNYITATPITIISQPENQTACEIGSTIFTIETNTIDSYQWQESSDGINWVTITNNSMYTNTTTNALTISNIPLTYNNYKYRVQLNTARNSCGLISSEAILTVNPLPIVTALVDLKQCDNDTDEFSFFNLTEVNTKISANAANETFTYYNSLAEAIAGGIGITNPTAFQNKTINTDVVWARVESLVGCSQTSEVKLTVSTTKIPSTFQKTFTECDDRDGIATFDFSSVDAEVRAIFSTGQLLTIKYYRNETDALSESNEITDISNYRNIGYPNTQQIFIRVDSQLNNDCLGFGAHITLNVEALPFANDVTITRQCDDDADGKFPFDTSSIESTVLNGQTNVIVTYYDELGNPLPSPLPNPFLTANQTIKILVTNNTTAACSDETSLEFIVDAAPIANPVVITPVCDDESNDGFYNFDTSTIEASILGSQIGMEVHYFDAAGTELSSPLPNPFNSATQTISANVINPLNSTCSATTTIGFVVNPLPDFEVNPTEILCLTEPASSKTLEVFQGNTSENLDYSWKNEKGDILSTNKTYDVNLAGDYYITLTKTDGTKCTRTKKITVSNSEIAKITYDNIVVNDDSNNNSISIISLESLGMGDYEFSLNDPDYGFQDEPFFNISKAGNYTLYVRDKDGCGISPIEVSVIQFPNFFTPNGDRHNDTWNVIGINKTMYPSITINIFNRFGKLIHKMDPNGNGWDGFFNGTQQPATDYWFSAELIDSKGYIKIKKGHFSLKR